MIGLETIKAACVVEEHVFDTIQEEQEFLRCMDESYKGEYTILQDRTDSKFHLVIARKYINFDLYDIKNRFRG